jgi:hypothetical protein
MPTPILAIVGAIARRIELITPFEIEVLSGMRHSLNSRIALLTPLESEDVFGRGEACSSLELPNPFEIQICSE